MCGATAQSTHAATSLAPNTSAWHFTAASPDCTIHSDGVYGVHEEEGENGGSTMTPLGRVFGSARCTVIGGCRVFSSESAAWDSLLSSTHRRQCQHHRYPHDCPLQGSNHLDSICR